jgi:hypothetical protein
MSSAEGTIQRAVFANLRARGAPGVFAFDPANGGHRKPVEVAIREGLGVVPGIPDVIALHDGCVFGLELKVEGGRVTPWRREALAAMEAAGATVAVAEGLDHAFALLEGRRLLGGRAS